jgi:hypothetical protein
MSAALTRTTSFTDHWRGQWSDVLHEMEDLEKADPKVKALRIAVPSRRGSSIGIEDVRAMVALTAQVNVTTMVPPLTSILRTMNLTILETNSEPGFITSDRGLHASLAKTDCAPHLASRKRLPSRAGARRDGGQSDREGPLPSIVRGFAECRRKGVVHPRPEGPADVVRT